MEMRKTLSGFRTFVRGGLLAVVVSVAGFACGEVPLPRDYTVLEWIESTGHQRLNTGWKASATLRCELDFAPLETSGNIMFGQGTGMAIASYRFFNYSGGYIFDCGGMMTGGPYIRVQNGKTPLATNGTRYLLKLGIDDENKAYATVYDPSTGAVVYDPTHQPMNTVLPACDDIYVFGGNLTDSSHVSGTWFNEKMRLYGLKMYDVKSGETERSLVRDFVPCRNEEGLAGLWEKVEGRFYTNCSEVNARFVGPDDVVARTEWIKSTGSQWLDTGVNASINLEAEMDFISHAHTGDITIGVTKDDKADWRFFDYAGGVLFDCGNARVGSTSKTPLATGTRYFAQFGCAKIANVDQVYNRVYVKGSATAYADYTASVNGTPAANPVGVFGGYADSKNTIKYAQMTLFSLKLMESGTLVRDYVPCIAANGLYGLMDLANGNAVNLGSGIFQGSPSVFELEDGNATLALREGPLTADLAAGRTLIAKASPYVADFSAVTTYRALELRKGTLSVQDGQVKTYEVSEAMTIVGGTRLAIDLTASGCDRFTAGVFALSGLNASAPLFVDVTKAADLTQLASEYVIAEGVGVTDGVLDYVVARGDIPARFEVRSGNLVMIPLLDVPVTATWRGDATSVLTDSTKWEYANALGQVLSKPDLLPTAEMKVILPDGCVFNWPKGTAFAHGEIVFPATLGGDCDWTGLDEPINATINLNGHTLQLSNLDGTGTLNATTGTVEVNKAAGESLIPGVDTVRLTGAVTLVLSGAGVKNVQDTAIADATDVEVLGGKAVVIHGKFSGTSNGGILHVASGAVLDFNLPGFQGLKDTNVHTDFKKNEPTHGKTIVLEGTLVNTPQGVKGANALVSRLVVKEGGTIGGVETVNRLDLRVLANSANTALRIEGEAPLAVRPGNEFVICADAEFALDRLDNHGLITIEDQKTGTVTNGVHCHNGSTFVWWYSGTLSWPGLKIAADDGQTTMAARFDLTVGGVTLDIASGVTVVAGNVANDKVLRWNGTLCGNGTLMGGCFAFGGDESCWVMAANTAGFTSKVNIDGLTRTDVLSALARIEVTKESVEPLPEKMVLGPAGALTPFEAGNIKVQVFDTEGVTCASGWVTIEDVAGVATAMLNVKDGVPILTATWTGAGDAANLADMANWVCSNETEVVERALPKETTVVTVPAGLAFNVPRTASLTVKEVRFAGPLVGDTDLMGLTGAIKGVIDLNGHKLTLSGDPTQPTDEALFVNGNLVNDGCFDLTSVYTGEYGYFNDTAGSGTNDFWWGILALGDSTYRSGVGKNPGTFAQYSYSGQTVGFVQMDGTLYQKVAVPKTGDYVLSYFASERQAQSKGHTCKVLIDDVAEPVATTRVTGATWTNVVARVHLEAGEHTLFFQGEVDHDGKGNAIDSTTILDNVSLVRADLPVGEIELVAGEGVAAVARFRILDDIVITKTGAGTVTMDDEIIRATTNLTIESGTVKIDHVNKNIRSVGGTIIVETAGTLDFALDAASNIHTVFGWNEPTHGKTIILAGTLQNVAQGTGANALVSHLVVKEGARIGGSSAGSEAARIDVRTLANSANLTLLLEGDATLTALPGNHLILCDNMAYALDRIDNYGWVQFEGPQSGTITNNIHCYDGSTFGYWGAASGLVGHAWVVETGTVDFYHNAITQGGHVIVIKSGATMNSVGTGIATWNGRLSGNGAITGSTFVFGGDDSCWAMKADDTGFTEKVDYSAIANANFLVGLKAIEVVYTGDKTVARRFVIGPALNLTQTQADAITLMVADAQGEGVPDCHLYVNAEGMLELNVAMPLVEKATYTGRGTDPNDLSDPTNWSCMTADQSVEGGLPMSLTEITIPSDKVFTCTNVDQVAFASVVFPASIPGDSDWRGLGTAPINTTIDLRGHKLYVSELKGTGTITDTTALLGANLIQDGTFENTAISANSGLWGYFKDGGSRSSYWTTTTSDRTGFTKAGSPWVVNPIDGTVSALVQKNGDLYQNVTIPEDGAYVLTYSYASRKSYGAHSLKVVVDDGSATLGRTDSAAAVAVNKVVLHLTAGTHKIAFVGLTTSDVTTILDGVSLQKIPAAGELHVVVPEGKTAEWTSVKIEGVLKFVKEGAGTYLASNKNGTGIKTWYLGDTWVREGCYKVHQSSSPNTSGKNVEYGFYQVQQLGAQGSETTVEAGATFDCGGNYDGYCYTIVLNGGTFGNLSTLSSYKSNGVPSLVRLTDDSFVEGLSDTQLGETDLGGHTLTVTIDPARSLYLRGPVKNGTLVSQGGRFWPYGGDWDMADVDLVLNSKMSCADQTITFRNLTVTYTGTEFGHGGKSFNVRGTYAPVSDQIWRFNLLDGATIDLSVRTTPLNIQPDANGLFFDENAKTIYVSTAGRELHSSVPLLTWTTKPEVKFVSTQNSKCRLIAEYDGLYPRTGLCVFIR